MPYHAVPMESAIVRACKVLGSRSALAGRLGVSLPTVAQWVHGERPVPPNRCAEIELHTGSAVTCDELRQDITWSRVTDAAWPHPLGRPCIDIAAPPSTSAKKLIDRQGEPELAQVAG